MHRRVLKNRPEDQASTLSGKPYASPRVKYYQHIHRTTGDKVFHTFGEQDDGKEYLS